MENSFKQTREDLYNQLYDVEREIENQCGDYQHIKKLKSKVSKIKRQIKKNAPKLIPGQTYSVEQFADTVVRLESYDKEGRLLERFKKDNDERRLTHTYSDKEIKQLVEIIGTGGYSNVNQASLFAYFIKSYDPTDIKIEQTDEKKEEVESNNIYDIMGAKSTTYYKGSFKLLLSYNSEPITIVRHYSKDTTLDQADIRAFM